VTANKRKLPERDEDFLAAVKQHGSYAAVARAYGTADATVKQRMRNIKKRRPDLIGKAVALISEPTPELTAAILADVQRNPRSMEELAAKHKATPEAIHGAIGMLSVQGYSIMEAQGRYALMRVPFVDYTSLRKIPHTSGRIIRFGAVSDSHFGSKAQQRTALHKCYRVFEQHEIANVFNSGDLVAGVNMYPEQPYEVYLHGADEQVEAAIADYPSYPGCTTRMIGGNHDASFIKSAGHDIFRRVAAERPDIDFGGWYESTFELGPLRVRLWHPRGGVPYAKSYRIQRLSEGIAHGPNVPHVILYGHLHQALHMEHLGIQQWLVPSCEGSTAWTRRLGLIPCIGGYIITIVMSEDGSRIEQMSQQLLRFPEIEHDWVP
jgi:hypothetical protein